MQPVLLSAIALVLLAIVSEDFRSRTVHAFWFPVLLMLAFIYSIQSLSIGQVLDNVLISAGFLLVQGVLLVGYFAVKHRRWINITEMYLGWGDILFIVAVLPLFSSWMFILFYLVSLLLTIVFVALYKAIGKEMVFIPLAGLQAFFLLLLLVYHQFVHTVLFRDMYLPLLI